MRDQQLIAFLESALTFSLFVAAVAVGVALVAMIEAARTERIRRLSGRGWWR